MEAKSEEFGDLKDLFALWYRQGYLVKIAAQGQTPEHIVWGPRSKIMFTEEKIAAFMVKVCFWCALCSLYLLGLTIRFPC